MLLHSGGAILHILRILTQHHHLNPLSDPIAPLLPPPPSTIHIPHRAESYLLTLSSLIPYSVKGLCHKLCSSIFFMNRPNLFYEVRPKPATQQETSSLIAQWVRRHYPSGCWGGG